MKTTKTLLIISILTMILLSACNLYVFGNPVIKGSGEIISKEYDVSNFDKVVINSYGRMILKQSGVESLEIEAEDNILPELEVEVRNNTLYIGFNEPEWKDTILPTRTIIYFLNVKEIEELEINGALDIEADDVETTEFTITTNGAGNFEFDSLDVKDLNVILNGGAKFEMSGEAINQDITFNGAGEYYAGDLETQATNIIIRGAGNATVWATDSLRAEIDGAGNINYYGKPDISQEINGVGTINRMGER
ncbi:MAG: DUF2807 domain-containing protein [Anaerolineaceae bacterium]|nr:DUF2807 domain-containing protein [Anaerolineaceae bacterium]